MMSSGRVFDVVYGGQNEEGEVKLEFRMEGAKPTMRWFKDAASALNFSGFVAAQHGANNSAALRAFLEKSGFPERDLAHFGPANPVVEQVEEEVEKEVEEGTAAKEEQE